MQSQFSDDAPTQSPNIECIRVDGDSNSSYVISELASLRGQ